MCSKVSQIEHKTFKRRIIQVFIDELNASDNLEYNAKKADNESIDRFRTPLSLEKELLGGDVKQEETVISGIPDAMPAPASVVKEVWILPEGKEVNVAV